jgi:phage terminase Nu1 subunit (DNA packaging protein)
MENNSEKPRPIRGATVPLMELANYLGISTRTLRENVKQNCPVYQRGSRGTSTILNAHDWLKWHDERIRTENRGEKTQAKPVDESKERIQRAIAEKRELELEQARGGLFHVDDWSPFMDDVMVQIRIVFMATVERFREQVPEGRPIDKIADWLASDITATLNLMSKGLKAIPDEVAAADAGGGKRRS